MNEELIRTLKQEYTQHTADIELILTYIQRIEDVDQNTRRELIEKTQQIINNLYNTKPHTALIDVQVKINQYRNQYDITDPTLPKNDEGYIQ